MEVVPSTIEALRRGCDTSQRTNKNTEAAAARDRRDNALGS